MYIQNCQSIYITIHNCYDYCLEVWLGNLLFWEIYFHHLQLLNLPFVSSGTQIENRDVAEECQDRLRSHSNQLVQPAPEVQSPEILPFEQWSLKKRDVSRSTQK